MILNVRQRTALFIAAATTVIPGMLLAGLLPEFAVLPQWAWFAIASSGASIGGAVSTKRWIYGALSGILTGLGMMSGIAAYVTIRSAVLPSMQFLRLEIAIGATLGALPGLITYARYANEPKKGPVDGLAFDPDPV
jgi:hypothetical protein